jgi:hypothetical protein
MSESVFCTSISELKFGEDGIGRAEFLPGRTITLRDLKEHFAVCAEVSNGKCVPVLADIRKIRHMERDARMYFTGREVASLTKAVAVLVKLPVNTIFGNMLMEVNKPAYPVRLFTSESKALEWLKQFAS